MHVKLKSASQAGDYHNLNSLILCPEQKQPNERVCTVMEAGSSFGEIDNILICRLLKLIIAKIGVICFQEKSLNFK